MKRMLEKNKLIGTYRVRTNLRTLYMQNKKDKKREKQREN